MASGFRVSHAEEHGAGSRITVSGSGGKVVVAHSARF